MSSSYKNDIVAVPVMRFEDILKEMPTVDGGSSAQMMAVYSAFRKGLTLGVIERIEVQDPKAPMYVRREFYRTNQEYVGKKRRKPSAQGVSSEISNRKN